MQTPRPQSTHSAMIGHLLINNIFLYSDMPSVPQKYVQNKQNIRSQCSKKITAISKISRSFIPHKSKKRMYET